MLDVELEIPSCRHLLLVVILRAPPLPAHHLSRLLYPSDSKCTNSDCSPHAPLNHTIFRNRILSISTLQFLYLVFSHDTFSPAVDGTFHSCAASRCIGLRVGLESMAGV